MEAEKDPNREVPVARRLAAELATVAPSITALPTNGVVAATIHGNRSNYVMENAESDALSSVFLSFTRFPRSKNKGERCRKD
ncbi:hypothetical protein GN958_ATG12339 [Phytophthora infestans]|uniref:Uncharacterized protein n=1 Tax=Phytophthora infestans TaxID=4787 RepID=A0A8S9UD90_PHYIN|nr:hypothetical protein GN958_ATG12339 [Phytophthora infestans]